MTDHHCEGICFGYAAGRSFSKGVAFSTCNVGSIFLPSMPSNLFSYTYGLEGLSAGDIFAFDYPENGTIDHVAFIEHIEWIEDNIDPNLTIITHTQNEFDAIPDTNSLSQVLASRGWPVGYYRNTSLWGLKIQNTFPNGTHGGKVEYKFNPSNDYGLFDSPAPVSGYKWGTSVLVRAYEHGKVNGFFRQSLSRWLKGSTQWPGGVETQVYIDQQYGSPAPEYSASITNLEFLINGPNTTIPSGDTVELSADNSVTIAENAELIVYGTLKIIGGAGQRITLSSPVGTSWKGIRFEGSGANGSELRYIDIVGATNPIKVSGASAVIVDNVSITGGTYGMEAVDATSLNLQYVSITGSTYPIKMTSTSGATLNHVTISGNNWSNAAMQFYTSNPNITYATIDGSGQAYASNGVRFSGSTGSISNSTIRNCAAGNGIVIQSGSAPTISGNTISGNYYYGIVFPTNGYQFAKIMNNTISGNSGGGIVVNGSNSVVKNNIITGSNVGIYLENSSYLTSVDASENWLARKKGGNAIYGNNYGLIGYSSAYYYFGEIVYEDEIDENRWDGSCNDVYGNTLWNIWTSWTQWKAKGNFWGYVSPPTTFTIGDGATVQYLPYNESPGWSCSQLEARVLADGPGKATKPVELAQLTSATKARIAGNYTDGVSSCREVLSGNFTVAEKQLALIEIAAIMRDSRDESLLADFDESRYADAGLKDQVQLMKGNALIGFKRLEDAAHVYESLAESRPKTDAAKMALMSLSSLYAFDSKHESKSRIALSTLQADFGDEVDKGWLAALSIQSSATTGPSMTEVEEETSDLSVFPNPFNPSTEIRFSVKSVGEVRIEVFDLIGRSVDILVNHTMQAGSHSVSWNGDRHPSGMYLLRFTSGNVTVSKKLLLTK